MQEFRTRWQFWNDIRSIESGILDYSSVTAVRICNTQRIFPTFFNNEPTKVIERVRTYSHMLYRQIDFYRQRFQVLT